MYPTLFAIGRWNIPTYTVLLDLGLILGLLLTYFEGRRRLGDGSIALDLGLWAVIGGIVGGRIAYVLANWNLFSGDWVRALRIWEGGLSFHGAFLAGLLVMVAFALLRQRSESPISLWILSDILSPGLALGIAFGWIGCLMGGCAYGISGQGFGYAVLPDLYGIEASRFATQAVGIAFALLLFVGTWLARRSWPFSGATFLIYVLLYFGGQFFLEFTRGDEAIYVGPWRLAQVLNLILALSAAVGLLALWWLSGQEGEPEPEQPLEGSGPANDGQAVENGPAPEPSTEALVEQQADQVARGKEDSQDLSDRHFQDAASEEETPGQ
jgi:phosphatidylglycerol:prolipoprotein diacylglycerol transferase